MTPTNTYTVTPTNTQGFCVERRNIGVGWQPCTEPVATLKEAQAQLAKLGVTDHRVYWAFKK